DDFAPFAGEGASFDGAFPETVTAPAGTPSGTVFQVPIPVAEDAEVEGDEVADLRVTSAATVTGADVEVTLTDKPVVQFAAESATTNEGSTVDIAVTLSVGAPEGGATVDVVLLEDEDEGTSAADLDGYETQTVTFAEGEQTATVTVTVTEDSAAEPAETFAFELRDAVGATVGTPDRFTLTVSESAQAVTLTVAETTVTAREGASSTVTVTLTTGDGAPLDEDTPFTVSLDEGSTADNDDFAPFAAGGVAFDGDFPETLVAPAGTPSGTAFTLPVPLEDDGVVEGDEVANLRVTSAGATVVNGDVALTIEDAPAVAFQDATLFAAEGETVEVVLELSEPARGGESIVVFLVDDEDEATTSEDLGGFDSQTITFAEGDTEATIAIEVTADGSAEDDESFRLALGQADLQPNGLGIGEPSETTLTVSLSTPAVEFESADLEAAEGESVTVSLRLSDAASGGESVTVVLDGASPDGAGADDLGGFTSETVTFDGGDTSASFEIAVTSDGIAEGEETFTLVLEDADGLDLADGTEIALTVTPSRTGVRFADAAFQVAEGSTAILTLELGSPAQGGEAVEVVFAGGTDGADLGDIGGFETRTVTFAAGDTTATVEVEVTDDGRTESEESFTFRLQDATGLDIGAPDEAVVTVDPSATTISFGGQGEDGTITVGEGAGSFSLQIEFEEALSEDAAFDVVLASSSDDAGENDMAAETGAGPDDFDGFESETVEVEAGATSATVVIPVTDDSIAEGAEQFVFEIRNATGGGPNGLALGDASVTVVLEDNDNPTSDEAALEGAVVGRVFPNPTAGAAQFDLSVDVPQTVRVTVVDAVGRVVEVLDLEVSGTERVEVGGGLAPGVYLIQVTGTTVTATQQITVAR
ncbi:Calx-beta domain-containing protein, partial [Rubrivirga sp.]|uniref:Calx-beta domain-containing protein n=1 Tax=Rubrivirga sp. TaxID=1885344 RepID=UPI003C745F4D